MKRLLDDGEEYYSSLFDEDSPVDRFPDLRELFEPEDLPGCCLVASAEELEAKRAAVMDAFVAWDDEEKKPYKFDSRAQKPHLFHVLRDFEQHVLSSCYELWMFLLNHRSDPSPDARTTFCLILGSVMEQHRAMDARVAEMVVEPEMSLDFLLRLPKDVFQFLFQHHLDLDDLLALSCTCKAMRERINSDSFCCVWQLFSDRSPTTFLYKEDPFEGVSLDAELATLMKKPPFSLFACGHVQLVSKLQLGQQVCGKCTLHDFQRGVRRKMALHQWWKDIRSAIEIQNIEDDVDVESNRVHLLVLSPEAFTLLMTENSNSRASRSSQRLAHLTSFLDDARRNLMYDDEWQLEYEYLASNKPSAELELAQWEMEVEMLRNDVAAAKQELLDELNVASDKFVKATKSNIDVDISLESVEFDFHGVKQNDGFVLGVLSMYEMVKRGFEFRFRGMGFKRETLYDN